MDALDFPFSALDKAESESRMGTLCSNSDDESNATSGIRQAGLP